MNPQEYEQAISEIVRSIFERVEGLTPKQVKYGGENRWLGESGFKHQIDVSVQSHHDLLLVECKYWDRNVPVEAVLAFFGRVYDVRPMFDGQVHPIIATKVGFQPGAELLAKHFNIDLQVIPSASVFGFMYKSQLLIQPAPATARATGGDPIVVVSDAKNAQT